MNDLTALYCSIDDFWKSFKNSWENQINRYHGKPRGPEPLLSIPEMMTIMVAFHQSHYRHFKAFYTHVLLCYKREFPHLISYSRFVQIEKTLFIPLFAYLLKKRGHVTGISFIDSTSIKVCQVKRASRNKVFRGIAKKGKTTIGWFYGFKLHLIINERGEILSFLLTQGHVADITVCDVLSKGLLGKLFGDKGYLGKEVFEKLWKRGLKLITSIRSNMKQRLMTLEENVLLRKRAIIETVNDQLKNISQVEHTRHRSPANFLINLLSGLLAYALNPKKPCLNLNKTERQMIAVA